MTEEERIQKIHNKKFEVEKLITRLSELMVELHNLGCDAGFKYETADAGYGNLSFFAQIGDPR